MKSIQHAVVGVIVAGCMSMTYAQVGAASAPVAKAHARRPAAHKPVVTQDAYQRALAALRVGQISAAHELLRQRLVDAPQDMAARRLLAKLLIEADQRDEASAVLAAGHARSPQSVDVAETLAHLQADRGDYAQALQTLEDSAGFAAQNAPFIAFMAVLRGQINQPDRAVSLWQQALKLAPQEATWWLALGQAQQAVHDVAGARQSYEAALASGRLEPAGQRQAKLALHQLRERSVP